MQANNLLDVVRYRSMILRVIPGDVLALFFSPVDGIS